MNRTIASLVSLSLLTLFPACNSGPTDGAPQGHPSQKPPPPGTTETSVPKTPGDPKSPGVADASKPPVAIASLTLANGNVVAFYDINGRGLLTEAGAAYTAPVLDRSMGLDGKTLVEAWTALAPNRPVPQSLIDYQERAKTQLPPAKSERSRAGIVSEGGTSLNPPIAERTDGLLAFQDGCSNGCCDYDWLNTTFSECSGGAADYSWFYFNYGSSYMNVDDIDSYYGFVCSAEGTSTYKATVNGRGGNWPVPQGTWLRWKWMACIYPWCSGNLRSEVNSPSSRRLHTYCGNFDYFW